MKFQLTPLQDTRLLQFLADLLSLLLQYILEVRLPYLLPVFTRVGQNYSEYSFREALFSKNFSDIHLKLKDESGSYSTIHAHRVILWCRSKSLLKDITLKGIRGNFRLFMEFSKRIKVLEKTWMIIQWIGCL